MTHILVIDDAPEIITMLKTVLSSDSCRIQTALNGLEGIRLLRKFRFDVVITDIIMPEGDGFEVIMEISHMQPQPRVIVMTGGSGYLSREYIANIASTMKVQRVLFKPFSIDELLDEVFLLERHSRKAA